MHKNKHFFFVSLVRKQHTTTKINECYASSLKHILLSLNLLLVQARKPYQELRGFRKEGVKLRRAVSRHVTILCAALVQKGPCGHPGLDFLVHHQANRQHVLLGRGGTTEMRPQVLLEVGAVGCGGEHKTGTTGKIDFDRDVRATRRRHTGIRRRNNHKQKRGL